MSGRQVFAGGERLKLRQEEPEERRWAGKNLGGQSLSEFCRAPHLLPRTHRGGDRALKVKTDPEWRVVQLKYVHE